jgi:hypothetical protein
LESAKQKFAAEEEAPPTKLAAAGAAGAAGAAAR